MIAAGSAKKNGKKLKKWQNDKIRRGRSVYELWNLLNFHKPLHYIYFFIYFLLFTKILNI